MPQTTKTKSQLHMKSLMPYAFFLLLFGACNSAKRLQTTDTDFSTLPGDTRTKEVKLQDANSYLLTEVSTDTFMNKY